MDFIKTKGLGILVAAIVASIATFFSGLRIGSFSFEVIGAPVFAILIGMFITMISPKFASSEKMKAGVTFTSKKILQYAVIILGFSLNIKTVLAVGSQSLPVIISTISTSLITAYAMCKLLKMDKNMKLLQNELHVKNSFIIAYRLDKKFENVQANDSMEQNELGERFPWCGYIDINGKKYVCEQCEHESIIRQIVLNEYLKEYLSVPASFYDHKPQGTFQEE